MSPIDTALIGKLLLAAVLEEIVFRVGLHEGLLRWRESRSVARPSRGWVISAANALTAVFFALAHALSRFAWLGLATLPTALLLGWVYERYRRVWPCMLLHAAFNLIWVLLATKLPFDLLH